MKRHTFLILIIFGFFGCSQETEQPSSTEKSYAEIKAESNDPTSIIRVPISADGTVDSVNVAKMTFESTKYEFGAVKEGDIVSHVFKFKNDGGIPLIISNASSTCGCTIPKWPEDPVPPGGEGEIKVRFDTKNKKNHQTKPVTILANTYPNKTVLNIKGFVKPKN